MPGQHGQTYDPQEEPAPRGGWFAFVERPFPEKVDRASRWVAVAAAVAACAGFVAYMNGLSGAGLSPAAIATAAGVGLIPAAMTYGFTRGVGMVLVGIYATARHGSEFTVDWRAVRHDAGLRRTWILILEGALLLAAAGVSAWAGWRLAHRWQAFDLAVLITVQAVIYWPLIRRRIAAGRTRG